MAIIECARCGETGQQMDAPPLPSDLGNRIFDSICQVCWDEWLRQQTAIINHYGLDLRQPQARQFLTQQIEAFLFGQPPE
jgi:Fe-S cluster biosynthesis and repair protein YggX